MPTRVEWHPAAIDDLKAFDSATRQRIVDTIGRLRALDDPRQRLLPYVEDLKGFWKLRIGDYRAVCEIARDQSDQIVLIIHVVHRGEAYLRRSIRTIQRRSSE